MASSDTASPATSNFRWMRAASVCLFLCTGATGLVYEVVWLRLLGHVFGNTAAAATTVLAAFMCGLGLGSLTIGARAVRRGWATLRTFALLEAAIAVYALAVPALLHVVQFFHWTVYPSVVGMPAVLMTLRFSLAFAVLLVPTTLMGATLPVLTGALAQERKHRGRQVGMLYGMNTAGAVVGCLVAGFVGIRVLGVTGTLYAAVACNLALAGLAYLLGTRGHAHTRSAPVPTGAERAWTRAVSGWAVVACIGGATALAYEVLWMRTLTFYLNNSTYAFTGMLATFLLGLAGGTLLVHRMLDSTRGARAALIGAQVVAGVWALVALPYVQQWYATLGAASATFGANFWGVPPAIIMAKCLLLMGLPAVALGMVWPTVTALAGLGEDVSRRVGHFYAVNTLGACFGAVVAGFVLLPALGVHRSLQAVGLVNIGVAIAITLPLLRPRLRVPALVAAGAAAYALLVAVGNPGVLRRADERWSELHFARDTQAASVKVYSRASDGQRVISINGYEVAGTGTNLREIQTALAHYPMLLHPTATSALVIGFGAGGTSYGLTLYPLERIDAVELVPAVIEASPALAAVNHMVAFREPRFEVILDDGRNYIQCTDRTYDVITVDAIDPKHAGNGHLYAREFYADARRRLNASGVFAQWLPYHLLSGEELGLVMRTFQDVFPETSLWFTPYYNYLILVGTKGPLVVDVAQVKALLADRRVGPDAHAIGITDASTWLATFALGPADIRAMVGTGEPLNTYDRPRLEFFTGSNGPTWGALPFDNRRGLPALNVGSLDQDERTAFAAALPRALEIGYALSVGRTLHSRREYGEARRYYRAVVRAVPQNRAARYLLAVLRGQVRQAIDLRLEAAERLPDDGAVLFELATLYEQSGAATVAERYYREAIEADPADHRSYLNLGQLFARRGDILRAATLFTQALDMNPHSARAGYNLALVRDMAGDHAGAMAALQQAQRALTLSEDCPPHLRTRIQTLAKHLRA